MEANPGPPRGRGRGSKGASGFSPPTGRGAGSTDYFSDSPNPNMTPLRRSQRLHERRQTDSRHLMHGLQHRSRPRIKPMI